MNFIKSYKICFAVSYVEKEQTIFAIFDIFLYCYTSGFEGPNQIAASKQCQQSKFLLKIFIIFKNFLLIS